jgi:hypothetical protein
MSLLLVEAAGWRPIGAHLRVDFRHLPADCTVALIGDNGAGKSTLLRLIGYSEHGDALVGRGWAADMRHPRSPEATVVVWRALHDGRLLKIRRRISKRETHVFIDIFLAGVPGACPPPSGNVNTANGSEIDAIYGKIANGKLYLRDQANLLCFDIKK